MTTGSGKEFRENWIDREEANYSHFTSESPINQIQFAFRQHWETWNLLFPELRSPGKVLEAGSGRGTMSMYFSQSGWDSSILDIVPEVLDKAVQQFRARNLGVTSVIGDCEDMPFASDVFDVVFSIGLLEHFLDPFGVVQEKVRVIKPGGLFVGYVVPEIGNESVQHEFEWVNKVLRAMTLPSNSRSSLVDKSPVFRTAHRSDYYLRILGQLGCTDLGSSGTYPVPMISMSPEFPFSLLSEEAEFELTAHLHSMLSIRRENGADFPWLCDESYGQAFLVWGRKGTGSAT